MVCPMAIAKRNHRIENRSSIVSIYSIYSSVQQTWGPDVLSYVQLYCTCTTNTARQMVNIFDCNCVAIVGRIITCLSPCNGCLRLLNVQDTDRI